MITNLKYNMYDDPCVCVCDICSLVTVVVESVVAPKSCQGPQTDSIRKEDLCGSINPYLPS